MPFLRPGHVVTFAPTPKFRQLGLLTLFSLSAASSVGARPSKTIKPVGVRAWTSGSQTYLRARPGSTVPPVAKVTRHTPLFVWGKYNGWYRVETHDHIFGWVFNEYINSPDLEKVPEMARSKARLASNRTANQTMYGTPEVLKKHFITYGAKGALDGLKKQGVYLATAPKASAKPRTLIAKTSKSASKPVSQTAKPRLASAPRLRERIVIEAPAPRAYTPRKTAQVPVNASPIPVLEVPEGLTPVTNLAPIEQPKLTTNFGGGERTVEAPIAPRSVETQKIAGTMRSMTPSAKLFARAANIAASQSNLSVPPVERPLAPRVAPVAVAPVAIAPIAPVAPRPAPRVAAKPKPAAKKPVAKTTRKSRYAANREKKREQLRLRMGLSPNSKPPTVIAPVSPLELMKAREEYLTSRKARLGSPAPLASAVPDSPVIGLAPLPAPSGPLGGPTNNSLAPASPANIAPMSFEVQPGTLSPLVLNEGVHPLYPILNDPQVLALAQLKPKTGAPIAARGGSPRDRAANNRGGSPRDRIASGMATQALSYRGMPYIRGAANPKRGFDCSGLVYFLLRQRGYNPPRTAAGYRNWGQGVPRGQWKAGDLVLFANTYKRGVSHIGVYLGEGKFVHAATSGTGVRVSSLNESYYAKKYYGARRVK